MSGLSTAVRFDNLLLEMNQTALERDRLEMFALFLCKSTPTVYDWLYKNKVSIMQSLYDLRQSDLISYLFAFFTKMGVKKNFMVNFIRKTVVLKKIVVLMKDTPAFRDVKWTGEAYMKNPWVLYRALKDHPHDRKLAEYAKRLVSSDARYAMFFRVFTPEQMVALPKYSIFKNMVEFETLWSDHISFELTFRSIINQLQGHTYKGSRWFLVQGGYTKEGETENAVPTNAYVKLIAEFTLGKVAHVQSMGKIGATDRGRAMVALREKGVRFFLGYPKQPLVLIKKKKARKELKSSPKKKRRV